MQKVNICKTCLGSSIAAGVRAFDMGFSCIDGSAKPCNKWGGGGGNRDRLIFIMVKSLVPDAVWTEPFYDARV